MADPGGVLISRQVYDQVYKKLSVGFEYLGERRPRNFTEDVAVYRVATGADASAGSKPRRDPPKVRPSPPPEPAAAAPGGLKERIIRHAVLLGAIWAMLLVINLVTGDTLWAQWPGLAMATLVALEACPLFVRGWFKLQYARLMVIIALLALINLFTWSGYPWFLWPAGALLVIELARRLRSH